MLPTKWPSTNVFLMYQFDTIRHERNKIGARLWVVNCDRKTKVKLRCKKQRSRLNINSRPLKFSSFFPFKDWTRFSRNVVFVKQKRYFQVPNRSLSLWESWKENFYWIWLSFSLFSSSRWIQDEIKFWWIFSFENFMFCFRIKKYLNNFSLKIYAQLNKNLPPNKHQQARRRLTCENI